MLQLPSQPAGLPAAAATAGDDDNETILASKMDYTSKGDTAAAAAQPLQPSNMTRHDNFKASPC
eukprot:4103250-Pleurochrysis_carterae.AAC.3